MLLALVEKEFLQFLRHPFLPRMVIAFPMVMMLVIPWVTTMDVRHIGVVVADDDRSSLSRRLIKKLNASDYFTLHGVADGYAAALVQLEQGDADVLLEIPRHFERSLTTGERPGHIRVTANGVNALKGNLGTQYALQVTALAIEEYRAEQGLPPARSALVTQNRYNPTLDYRRYMIPALMIMLLVMLCGFMPALNMVGEKETGTIEQLNATPVSRWAFTLAKLLPYWLIGFVVLTLSMGIALWVYGLSPAGSPGAIYLAAALFILTMSGIGVTAANFSDTMQQVMFVMFFFIMIFVLMSGLLTPIESMPLWAQRITRFLPPRYFIEIMRSVYLKGTTVAELLPCYAALAGFAALCCLTATVTYRKQH